MFVDRSVSVNCLASDCVASDAPECCCRRTSATTIDLAVLKIDVRVSTFRHGNSRRAKYEMYAVKPTFKHYKSACRLYFWNLSA